MKALAASFVVTVGLAACTPAQSPEEPIHGNPPEPPIETYNPPGPEGEEPVPETPEEKDEPKAELPPAPPDANVSKRADGTCWATAKVDCPPPPATCNPPPPQQVACPDE